jgi:propanol-preferring alcohol dehydrogenase
LPNQPRPKQGDQRRKPDQIGLILAVAINAIHLDRMPELSYDLLWRERSLSSVANFTRKDAREFLDLVASIPIKTSVARFGLNQANEALGLLAGGGGGLAATAVLVP